MTAKRPALRALAARLGVVDAYFDLGGRRRETSDATREALCAAMGQGAASEAAARGALAALDAAERERWIEPVQVWREHDGLAPGLLVRAPASAPRELELELLQENGARHQEVLRLPAASAGSPVRVPLPVHPGVGRHRVRLRWHSGVAEQVLIVAPRVAWSVCERLAGARAFGVWSNLYTLRSERAGHQGIGDLGDLAALVRLVASAGGDFVGISPLHAIPARGDEVSPYGPTSRLYRSALYLDAGPPGEAVRERVEKLRAAARIDYEVVLGVKLEQARARHAGFEKLAPDHPQRRDFAHYLEREGEALRDFACFEALAETHGASDWRRWPARHQHVHGAEVEAFRETHVKQIEFRCWLQFELDRQLGEAAAAGSEPGEAAAAGSEEAAAAGSEPGEAASSGREAGLRVGLLGDLAVGCGPGSADTWAHPGLFAGGVSVGAPPDAFAAEGQDWGIAPLDPQRLRVDGHAFFTRLLRGAFRHVGALRIDHVMGLQRLFWIPEGRPATEGAYVRYPRDELLGVLALESRRAQALVVGEDLGTVPPELPRELASWAILSSSVLAFEREGQTLRPAAQLSPRALASANTHDLAPLVGYVSGRDLALRRAAGAFAGEDDYAAAQAARRAEVTSWRERFQAEGVLPASPDDAPLDASAWCAATAAYLARSPAPLVAISLDDLAGESEPVHLPGIGADRHPGWRRRMAATLETLAPRLRAGLPTVMLRPRGSRAGGER